MTNGNGGGARKHHYVPQCYLKRFTSTGSKKAQLFVLDAQTQQSFVTTPQNVAAEQDFNRIELDGEDPNLIESSYAEFETRVAPALVRTDARGSFTDDADKALIPIRKWKAFFPARLRASRYIRLLSHLKKSGHSRML